MSIELKVPAVGESITEVFIGEWLKNEGDSVKKDEPLVEIETDKATLEVPSPVDGVVTKLLVGAGDSANVGDVIAQITEGAVAASSSASVDNTNASSEAAASHTNSTSSNQASGTVMPAAARLAGENNIDASQVAGTGKDGRVLKEDVQAHMDSSTSSSTSANASTNASASTSTQTNANQANANQANANAGARAEEAVAMSPLRRTIAKRLVESQHTTASLTTFNEVDMSKVKALRAEFKETFEKKHGVRLGFMSFFVRATIEALKEIPALNARIEGNNIIYHNYHDIGVAVSGKKGLLVPIMRNAERLSFAGIESTISELGQRAQSNKITPEELTGGTFTISNGGVFGSMMSTPILNPPQSGVLGMHNIVDRPMAVNGEIVIRPMMYLALTYDHRIVDGKEAVTFLKRIKEGIENPARLLLEV